MIRSPWCIAAIVTVVTGATSVSTFADPPAAGKPTESPSILQEEIVYGRVHGAALLADIARPATVKSGEKLPAIIIRARRSLVCRA